MNASSQVPKGMYSVFRNSKSNCGRGYPAYKFQVGVRVRVRVRVRVPT